MNSSMLMTDERRSARSSLLGLSELPRLDLFVLVIVAFHLIVPSSPFAFPTVSQTVTLLVLGPVGLVVLARCAKRRDPASIAMAVFLASTSISAVFAHSPIAAFRGDVTTWTSVIAYAAASGWWALGRTAGTGAREALPWIVVGMMSLNGLLGLLQVAFDIRSGPLAAVGGRAQGLLDNPVYYGSLWAGACAWLLMRGAERTLGTWTFAVGGAAFAAGLSGSRATTIAVVLAAIVIVAVRRTTASIANVVVSAAGLVAASLFARLFTSAGTLDRINSNLGSNIRFDMWRGGLDAIPARPVFGHGFNHFSTAIDGELTLAFLRVHATNDLNNPTRDPHNLVILLLVSVGIVGAVLFGVWLGLALRGRWDPALVAAAAGIGATWMLQPATHHSLPIALMLLGAGVRPRAPAAQSRDEADEPAASRRDRWVTAGVAVGVGLSLYVATGTASFDAAVDRGPEQMARIAALFPGDSQMAFAVSLEYEAVAARGEAAREPTVRSAIEWAERQVSTAPSAQAFTRLARLNLAIGDLPAARVALDRAVDLQYWNPAARELFVAYAREADDRELLERALGDACTLGLPVCPDGESGEG